MNKTQLLKIISSGSKICKLSTNVNLKPILEILDDLVSGRKVHVIGNFTVNYQSKSTLINYLHSMVLLMELHNTLIKPK